ncbi:MAG: acetate--CoA ligase family protein, partial [Syntrophales bacterium]
MNGNVVVMKSSNCDAYEEMISDKSYTDDLFIHLLGKHRRCLMEHECKEILESIGVKTTGIQIALSEEDTVKISENIGYPVVMKIASPDVVHKSDLGGVKLNVQNDQEAGKAYRELVETFKNKEIAGVSVQKMADPGIEVIIGVTRDPNYGHVLMFGLGGVFVEILKDVTFRILPITEDDAADMIEEIKGGPLLTGYRGHSADIAALKELLLKISELVVQHPEISELDLNPVFLYPRGYVVVDARIFVDSVPQKQTTDHLPMKEDLHKLFYPDSI